MPKINKTKLLLIMLTLLIIVVIVMSLIMNGKDNGTSTNSPNNKTQHISIVNEPKDTSTEQNNLQQVAISPTHSEQPETKSDKSLFFSDDPFINRSIILGLYQNCIELFYLDKKEGIDERYKYKSLVSIKRIAERFSHCKKINNEHPEFNLDDNEKFYKKVTGANSLLEKAFNYKFSFGKDYMSDSQFIKELSQADPRILLNPTTFYVMSSFHMKNSTAIVMKLIHSQQIGHVWTLLDKAQQVYNCNLNGGCDKNSTLMYSLCINNEDYCHLENHNEFIKTIMTKGQQADLAIVVRYIETLFEDE